jgi:hypothetical protein
MGFFSRHTNTGMKKVEDYEVIKCKENGILVVFSLFFYSMIYYET